MAKAVDPTAAALAAIARALTDPGPKVLFGSAKVPGFFSGKGKAAKDAASVCTERGWLEATGEWAGKGKSAQEKYRMCAAGVHAALEQGDSHQLLLSLKEEFENHGNRLKDSYDQLTQLSLKLEPLGRSIATLERRLQPPSLEEIRKKLSSSPAVANNNTAPSMSTWLAMVVPLAAQRRQQDRFQPLDLPALFRRIRQENPNLTLGQFHDGLRTLRDQGNIRLIPFTRALATIEDRQNALFLDGEVMYYVDLP